MRQVVHMFYAAVFLMLASAGKPLNLGEILPSFPDLHQQIWRGEFTLENPAARIVYGRVHWEQLLQNIRQPRFEEALGIVSNRHAGQVDIRRLLPAPPASAQ
jgi:hypothetical protein